MSSFLFNLQDVMEQTRRTLTNTTVTIEHDLVQVAINGHGQILAITITDPAPDLPTLQNALLETVNQAILASQQVAQNAQIEAFGCVDTDERDDEPDQVDWATAGADPL